MKKRYIKILFLGFLGNIFLPCALLGQNLFKISDNQKIKNKEIPQIAVVLDFLSKIQEKTPITIEDENMIFSQQGIKRKFYQQLGIGKFYEGKFSLIKPMKVSYFGEFLRTKREKILFPSNPPLYASIFFSSSNNSFTAYILNKHKEIKRNAGFDHIILLISDKKNPFLEYKNAKVFIFSVRKENKKYVLNLSLSYINGTSFPIFIGCEGNKEKGYKFKENELIPFRKKVQ